MTGQESFWRHAGRTLAGCALVAAIGFLATASTSAITLGETGKADRNADSGPDGLGETAADNPFPRRFKAPDLDGGTDWLNAGGEITLRDLRGKIVLLDFWTYCCINCMHVLPDLKHLEKKYEKHLVVIGVHSAKFENEKESDNIRRAIVRYEIEHPVINDSEMTLWRKFGVNAWPTLVMIDPEGYYCGFISGEGHREVLETVIEKLIAYHKRKKTLDDTPVRFDLERHKGPATPLKFPGKVLADEASGRLFISDSNHNRIIVAGLDGRLRDTIGTGAAGQQNGPFDKATFDHPQGMTLVGETLYVADTENHLIRAVHLGRKTVTTVAGTGQQGYERRQGGPARKMALNSPWDLIGVGGTIYVAMAGPHQLWAFDPGAGTIEPFAGSGREDVLNGPRDRAALAQPSGITTDGRNLFFVDSEGSAVRRLPLDRNGQISTIAGASDLPNGRSLFEFGDRDGIGADARLQHPIGITFHDGLLYVADSYNHKIKKIDPQTSRVETWLGDGEPGDRNDPPRFSEPAGLSAASGRLYVADTNNHAIRSIDISTGETSTLAIQDLAPPAPQKSTGDDGVAGKKATRLALARIAPADALDIEAVLELPEGYKLNPAAPPVYRVTSARKPPSVPEEILGVRHEAPHPAGDEPVVRFQIPVASRSGDGEIQVTVIYNYCRDGKGGLCRLGTASWIIPWEFADDSTEKTIRLAPRPVAATPGG